MKVYDIIKRICEMRGLSIRQLELLAGLGNGVIGKWRSSSPRIVTLQKVADALKVPIGVLLNGR